jgi:hypothetical protein
MSAKPKTFQGDLERLPPALLPLTEQKHWLVWNWERRTTKGGKEKWTKPPRQARDPSKLAKSNDPTTWAPYSDALAAVREHKSQGIGYVLTSSDIGAADLDHVRDPDSGAVVRWAEQLIEEANGAYIEVTPSGTGLRILGRASGPEIQRKFTFDRKTGAGIELYRNTARYITVSGLQVGECAKLPPLDDFIDRMLARYDAAGFDFNKDQKLDYDDIIRNGAGPGANRSDVFQSIVWHLAGQGWSIEQITDELARHPNGIGAKYAGRLLAEVQRSYEKWRARKRSAATGKPASGSAPWPQILFTAGDLPRVIDEAEDALLLLGREFYQRGGLVVRPVLLSDSRELSSWQLIPVTRPHLVDTLTSAARFLHYDGRAKALVPIDAPDKVADAYLARTGLWRLPKLTGIVNAPFLRPDGSICERPGYDAATGILFKPDGQTFPPVPQEPTENDAHEALEQVHQLISAFPFVTSADWSVAMSAILTLLDRRNLPSAPLHAFTAPAAGTGKSLIVNAASMLATGRPMPVIAQGRNEEEMEKRLGAALLAGNPAISLDNCEHPLGGGFLCQTLSERELNIRVLGFSRVVATPVNAAIYATGNNLTIVGDLARRSLLCSLDAKCERPELRDFDITPLDIIRADRGKLVVSALTILRAFIVAGERVKATPFGSFEDWSRRIREPLIWLGAADPCKTMVKVREGDPLLEALQAVVAQWKLHLGTASSFTVQAVIGRATVEADFHAALLTVAASKNNGTVSNDRLGRWLKRVEGRIVDRLALTREGNTKGYPMWKLTEM